MAAKLISPSSARDDDGPTYMKDKYNEGNQTQTQTQLAIVPLHPGNPKKLEAKHFPVVLGRTNLASWWWKTCPCEKYCRLHCRPVAQNIRSLSKVMVMIDSKGEVHIVGKNPHLITIISSERTERTDNILRVNDILSIGRRDREPWMRLQVVRRTDHARRQANLSRKQNAPNRTTKKETIPNNKRSSNANSSRNRNNNNNNNNATTNRRISSPPEWITTTRKRKATSSSRSNNNTSSTTTIKQQQQQQRMSYGNGSEAHTPKTNTNKRRRTFRDPLILKHNSIHHNNNNNNDRQYPISSLGPARAADHIHLLFQDYETSAMLVKATQRKLSKKKSTNDGKSDNSRRFLSSNPPSRTFLADKSQLGLLSKNFAAALMGAVSPALTAAVNQDSQQQSSNDINESQTSTIDHSVIQPENEKLSPLEKSGEDVEYMQNTAFDSKFQEATMNVEESSSQKIYYSQQQEASILSLPCASYSLEPDGDTPPPAKASADAGVVAHSANFATAHHHQESDVSPKATDPITCLGPWRDIVGKEEPSSFRHALASLILAKNETNEEEALWLPDLLEDGISK